MKATFAFLFSLLVALPTRAAFLPAAASSRTKAHCQRQREDERTTLLSLHRDDIDNNRHASGENRLRRHIINSLVAVGGLSFVPAVVPAKDLKEDYRQGTAALSEMGSEAAAPVPREAYRKLENGVVCADLRTGGDGSSNSSDNKSIAKLGSRVNLQWVLRKSNGYFVDSSATHDGVPFIFSIGDGTAIVGVDEGIRGMKVGGVRRLLIPPSLAYVDGLEDGKPGPLPIGFGPKQQMRRVQNVRKDVPGEYVYLEVQLTRMR